MTERWTYGRRAAFGAAVIIAAVSGACARDEGAVRGASESAAPGATPDSFRVEFETSRGRFAAVAHRAWAPNGVDRFYQLVKSGYYDSTYFFRVIEGFVAQFGISGNPKESAAWRERRIPDDTVRHSNTRGTIAFASQGPGTRTVQLFINLRDNAQLDALGGGFPPIAEVVDGMATVDALYDGYGEGPPRGLGPRQDLINEQGNAYLERYFPQLDQIRRATVAQEWR